MLRTLFPRSSAKYTSLAVLGDVTPAFTVWLLERGYAQSTVRHQLRATCGIDRKLRRAGVRRLSALTPENLEGCIRDDRVSPHLMASGRLLTEFLTEEGILTKSQAIRDLKDVILADYSTYLRDVRGLVNATVNGHLSTVSRFLSDLGKDALAFRLSTLTPHDLETFTRRAAERYCRDTLSHVTSHVRSFLRFLSIRNLAPTGLDTHVDSPRIYRRERLPRALPWQTVRALLASIDRKTAVGIRDYCMLSLIATYGLRCCEVAALKLDDLLWRKHRIRVAQRKTGSFLFLPMTDEAGTVLEQYLRQGRPSSTLRQVFLRGRAPAGALKPTAVSDAFVRWSQRSGLEIPYHGAHCLRHSYAVNLLRHGTPLKTIGDILGHRLAESTCTYLGLAVEDLREVALAVPSQAKELCSED